MTDYENGQTRRERLLDYPILTEKRVKCLEYNRSERLI